MRPPAVLVAHGSPDPRSRDVVRAIAVAADATATFLDFDAPHPVAALTALADIGHRRATVIPLLLTHAYHGRVDVPRIAIEAGHARPQLSIDVTDPVGGPQLIPALLRRLGIPSGAERCSFDSCRGRAAAGPQPRPDALVLASAGTRDADTLNRLADLAGDLGHTAGVAAVAAYASAAEPSVADAVAELRARGHRRVAVAAYFIAPGVLHDRAATAAKSAGAVTVAPPLGSCGELVQTITDRRSEPAALAR